DIEGEPIRPVLGVSLIANLSRALFLSRIWRFPSWMLHSRPALLVKAVSSADALPDIAVPERKIWALIPVRSWVTNLSELPFFTPRDLISALITVSALVLGPKEILMRALR